MANLNSNITPAPVVAIQSQAKRTQTGATNAVTVSLAVNPTGATLSGTTTQNAVAGLATFGNLQLNRSGKGFRLRATSTLAGRQRETVSAPFDIPTKLVFTQQPQSGQPNEILDPIQVTVQDEAGNTDTNYQGEIKLSIYSATGDGVIGGFTTRLATNGVATFTDISISADGTYSLLATALPFA